MSSQIDEFEYDQRQYGLMIERLDMFDTGKLRINFLISDLKGLVAVLKIRDDEWISDFMKEWGVLEVFYALALDKVERDSQNHKREDLDLSKNDEFLRASLSKLRALVGARISGDEGQMSRIESPLRE